MVVRRCVARGDVHGDATTSVIYKVRRKAPAIGKRKAERESMVRCHAHVCAGYDWKRRSRRRRATHETEPAQRRRRRRRATNETEPAQEKGRRSERAW